MIHTDNAVTALCEAVTKVGQHQWPVRRTKTVDAFLAQLSEAYGVDLADAEVDQVLSLLGTLGMLVGATLQNTANPTMLQAGYKHNVIPGEAVASIDGRVLPGYEDEFEETIRRIVGDAITVESVVEDIAIEAPFDTPDGRPHGGRAARGGPRCAGGAVHDLRRHRREGVHRARHRLLRLQPAAGCPPTSTTGGCSTASTSACRSTDSSSGCGCSTASCGAPDRRQAVRIAR